MTLPLIAIVGRPNVGKSSYLNAAARRRVSIVHDHPGVTRDRVEVEIEHQGRLFRLMDMGGVGIVDDHNLDLQVESQINAALEVADVILFLLDVREGLTPLDRRVADLIRRAARPWVVAANKVDAERQRALVDEFFELGLGRPIELSCSEGHGVREVLGAAVALLPEARGEARPSPEGVLRLAIVGQRNSGKSTLLNALVGEERMIVSPIPGTTRDAVDVRLHFGERDLIVIDTAGMRKARKLADSVEYYSQLRSLESIRRAHVVVHLLDATRVVSQVDKKIASAIEEACRPCILAVNKWDLARDEEPKRYQRYLEGRLPLQHFAPLIFISAKQRSRLGQLLGVSFELYEQASHRVTTGALNRAVEKAAEVRGPRVTRGRYPRIYFATQVGVRPPWIVLFVNDPRLFKDDFRRFLENRFRKVFPFGEIPIRISFRKHRSL